MLSDYELFSFLKRVFSPIGSVLVHSVYGKLDIMKVLVVGNSCEVELDRCRGQHQLECKSSVKPQQFYICTAVVRDV